MRRFVKWTLAATAVLLAFAFGMGLPWEPGGKAIRGDSGGAVAELGAADGPPLFPFSDLYLLGRSSWMGRRFDAGPSAGEVSARPGAPPAIEVEVHSSSFTSGDWIGRLSEEQKELREDAERGVVESRVTFHVSGVTPERLALFVSCAEPGADDEAAEGERERRGVLWPLDDLPETLDRVPPLVPGQYLSRETWRPAGPLAQPTDAWFLNELSRTGDGWRVRYELWENAGDETCVSILLASGQYVFRPAGDGAVLHLHSFYRGQGFPPFLAELVRSRTRAYFERLCEAVRRLAPSWEPPSRVREWLRAVELESEPGEGR